MKRIGSSALIVLFLVLGPVRAQSGDDVELTLTSSAPVPWGGVQLNWTGGSPEYVERNQPGQRLVRR